MSQFPADFVYVLQIGDLYKIGRSTAPNRRVRNMQLPAKPQGRVYRVPDSRAAERQLHEQFKAKRVYGEWFRLSADDLWELELAVASHYLQLV